MAEEGKPRIEVEPSLLDASEERMRQTFEESAGDEARIADLATALLVHVLVRVGPRTVTGAVDEHGELVDSDDPASLILSANVFIGARAVRVIRAARAVLVHGFEPEARALDRILVELQAYRNAILDDATGREALAWLERRRTRGVSSKVAAMAPGELYANLSTDAHGDPAPLLRLLDPADKTIDASPQRTHATRSSLLMYAEFARDQATIVSELSGATVIDGLDVLDDEIRTAQDCLAGDAEKGPVGD